MKQAIERMKQIIKADAEVARQITQDIAATPRTPDTGPARCKLWHDKRSGRPRRRSRLLAYAMMRGVAYSRVEHRASEPASELSIHRALSQAISSGELHLWNRERIEAWLAGRGPAAAQERAA